MAKGFKHGAGGGAPLNFKVVGNPEPIAPGENTIWVNTETKITGYDFSATEPTAPVEGMVWFPVGTSSTASFNALKKNSLMVYPLSAKQYVGGAWVAKTAMIYQGGEWVDWFVYLYANGDTFDDITGGWATSGNGVNSNYPNTGKAPSVTYNADSVRITQTRTTQTGYSGLWHTKNKVSLAGRTKITALIENINYDTTNTEAYLQIRTGVTGYVWNSPETVAFATIIRASTSSMANTQPTIDLSSLNLDSNAEYYVCIGLYSTFQADIKNIKIE